MKKTLNMIVVEILTKNKKRMYTVHELADVIVKTEPEFCKRKMEKTGKTEKILLFQLMSEIGAQFPKIIAEDVARTETRPQKYFYKKRTHLTKIEKAVKAAREERRARATAREAAKVAREAKKVAKAPAVKASKAKASRKK